MNKEEIALAEKILLARIAKGDRWTDDVIAVKNAINLAILFYDAIDERRMAE